MDDKIKKRILKFIILVLLLLFGLMSCTAYKNNVDTLGINTTGNADTKISEDLLDNSNNQVRIIINPSVTVTNKKICGLDFVNRNASRYLQCKIKVDEEYIYDSQLLPPDESINNDIIDSNLNSGTYKAIAEIYSYDLDGNLIGQKNVGIQVSVK